MRAPIALVCPRRKHPLTLGMRNTLGHDFTVGNILMRNTLEHDFTVGNILMRNTLEHAHVGNAQHPSVRTSHEYPIDDTQPGTIGQDSTYPRQDPSSLYTTLYTTFGVHGVHTFESGVQVVYMLYNSLATPHHDIADPPDWSRGIERST